MRIALNAHFWGRGTTGSGQYMHALVDEFRAIAAGYNELDSERLHLILLADAPATRRAREHPPPRDVTWQAVTTPFDAISPNLAKVWFEQVAALRAARRADADVYHVPYFAPPLHASVPVVATVHDLIPMRLPAYRGATLVQLYTALVARAARTTDRILADSDASRRDVLDLLGVPAERVQTVYLAASEAHRPQSADAVAQVRAQFDLPDYFALYLGGFDVRKRVPLLIRALARTRGDWPLVVAGRLPERDTPFKPDPRHVARNAGVTDRVRFIGYVSDAAKPALYTAATLFVFPSIYEGFGLPPLEALSCGTPAVTTDASSLPEIVGDASRLVPPDDEHALAQALNELMKDRDARQMLAERALEQAERFSWRRTAEATLTAYRDVSRTP